MPKSKKVKKAKTNKNASKKEVVKAEKKVIKTENKTDSKSSTGYIISVILGIIFILATLFGTAYFTFPQAFNNQEQEEFVGYEVMNNEVNVYLFVDYECEFCKGVEDFLEAKAEENPKIKLHVFDVTPENPDEEKNSELLNQVAAEINEPVLGMPYTVIGDLIYGGFGETSSENMTKRINHCIEVEYCDDSVAEIVGVNKAQKFKE